MDKKKGIIVLLLAVVAILYFGGFLGGSTCTVEADDHICAESTLEGLGSSKRFFNKSVEIPFHMAKYNNINPIL